MWIKLDTKYNLKVLISNTVDTVYIANFIMVWSANYTDTSFLECLKKSNPHMCIDASDLDQVKRMLTMPEYLKSERTTITERDGTLTIALLGDKSKIGYPLHLTMTLTEGSKQMFYEVVTHDLVSAIHKLKASETELIRLLMKKDDEITEYKCEGGEIALRHLKTIPFDKEGHNRQYQCPIEHIPHPNCLPKKLPLGSVTMKTEIKEEIPTPDIQTVQKESGSDVMTTKTESSSVVMTTKIESGSDVMTTNTESGSDVMTTKTESGSVVMTTNTESGSDVMTTKTDSGSDVMTTKTESSPDVMTTKTESSPDVMTTKTESSSDVKTTKTESCIRLIKTEPCSQSGPSQRRKRIKLNI